MSDIHVYPENDLKPHDTDTRLCSCRPRTEVYGENAVVIHNSWDGREVTERAVDYARDQGRN